MATFKHSEFLEGNISELFNIFLGEALKLFDNLQTGYISSKQVSELQGVPVETEITGFEPSRMYQVTVQMPGQKFVKTYTFSQCGTELVRIDFQEAFYSQKPVLAINHWLMSRLMKKSLQLKISRSLSALKAR